MKLSVKKGDNVLVIAGKDAGKTGEILEVNATAGRVVVAGVNIQAHHNKPKSKDDKGGIIKSEGAIDVSNVQVVCPVCKKATRVAHGVVEARKCAFARSVLQVLILKRKLLKTAKKRKGV